MARVDALHWQAEPGDSWASVAAIIGSTSKTLALANGATVSSTTISPALKAGRIIHTPFLGGASG